MHAKGMACYDHYVTRLLLCKMSDFTKKPLRFFEVPTEVVCHQVGIGGVYVLFESSIDYVFQVT